MKIKNTFCAISLSMVILLTPYYALAVKRENIRENAKYYGVAKVSEGKNINNKLVYNFSKNKTENLENYKDKMIFAMFWESGCKECPNKFKKLDFENRKLLSSSDFSPIQIVAIANYYDNRDTVRKIYWDKNINHLDLLYLKGRGKFEEITDGKKEAYYLIDKKGSIFAEVTKPKIGSGRFMSFLKDIAYIVNNQ